MVPVAGLRAWLSSLANWLRGGEPSSGEQPAPRGRFNRSRLAFWFGLILLLCASTMLEWSRLYRLEAHLPGSGGGALGLPRGAGQRALDGLHSVRRWWPSQAA